MAREQAIIVDLTRELARICVTSYADAQTGVTTSDFVIPYRVAIRDEELTLRAFAGEASADIQEDDRTLIFDNLHTELLRVEDTELQAQLASAFWNEICRGLSNKGWLENSSAPVTGYIIPHYLSPPTLLERFHEACAVESPVRLAGFFHEGVALLMGHLRSEAFAKTVAGLDCSHPITFCLVTAEDDGEAAVACFDYSLSEEGHVSILLRDYFRTAYSELGSKLRGSDWIGTFSILISLESPELAGPSKDILDAMLGAISVGITRVQHRNADLAGLKTKGAAYIASCCAGRGVLASEYSIETAFNIGIRINQKQFHPLITKEEFRNIVDFPYSSLQTFKLEGRPGNEMHIQLYCGYSDRVADSTLLGHLTLSQTELISLTTGNESVMAAIMKLDAPGSGELTLGLLHDNRIINSMAFTLPGMVV